MSSIAKIYYKSQVHITLQGRYLKAQVVQPLHDQARPRGDRRPIEYFTHRSRKTLLNHINRLDHSKAHATFYTFTYHDSNPTARRVKRDLRTLCKRMDRLFGLKARLWRLERQKRGAWHIHLMVWDMPYWSWKDALEAWQDITGDNTITNIKIKFLGNNPRKWLSYTAKYIAKADSNLDIDTNLPVEEQIGRLWGIENRDLMPYAVTLEIVCSLCKGYYDFKRAARKSWQGVNIKSLRGFTLYVDDIALWRRLLRLYLRGNASSTLVL